MIQTTSTAAAEKFHWYSPFAIALLLAILMVVGPTVLVPAWFLRWFASLVPVWDPDRRWGGVRGCAVLFSLVYASLAACVLLFAGTLTGTITGTHLDLALGHIGQRALLAVFDFSGPALLHQSAGLLLTFVFALLLEQGQPHTDRHPIRIVTQVEKQLLEARAAERTR